MDTSSNHKPEKDDFNLDDDLDIENQAQEELKERAFEEAEHENAHAEEAGSTKKEV